MIASLGSALNSSSIVSSTTRLAPTDSTACASRMNSPSRSKAPVSTISAGIETEGVDGEEAVALELVEVEPEGGNVGGQVALGLLEGDQDAGLAEVTGTADQELDPEQGLARACCSGHQRRPAARQPAAGDLVEPVDSRWGPSPGRSGPVAAGAGVDRVRDALVEVHTPQSPRAGRAFVAPSRRRVDARTQRGKTGPSMRTPALAFPLRTHERLIEGPLWTATLVSQPTAVNAWSRPALHRVTHRLWKTLWTTCGGPALCCGSQWGRGG